MQCVATHELGELEEISDAVRLLQRLIQLRVASRNGHVLPEFRANLGDAPQCLLEPLRRSRHSTFVPHERTELTMKGIDGAGPSDRQKFLRLLRDALERAAHFRVIEADLVEL